MPRIKRRGFQRLYSYRLSVRQTDILLHGPLMEAFASDGPGFASEDEERHAWQTSRAELMAERLGPGRRPFAFFKFELKEEPRRWYDQVRLLLDNSLIDQPEAADIERGHSMLAPDPQCQFYASFDSEACVRRLMTSGPPLTIASHGSLFDFAAKWHTWRGREELAGRYKTRAEVVRKVAAEVAGQVREG